MITIIVILCIIILLLSFVLVLMLKHLFFFSKNEKKLFKFVVDMYLQYGDELDLFPSGNSKNILIKELTNLKSKIEKIKPVD